MNDQETETVLRKAPRVKAPPGLLQKLQDDISLPRITTGPANTGGWLSLLKRWIPAAACVFVVAAVIAVQTNTASKLRRENETLRASTRNLEQLRRDNAEYQRLLAERQELERLRKDQAEVQQLRAEVVQLRSHLQEISRLRAENQQLLSAAQQPGPPPANQDFFAQAEDPNAKALSIQCVNNLKQIGLAARIWATDNSDILPPNWLSMSNELSVPKLLICPADTGRLPALDWASFSLANVSYEHLNPNGSEEEPYVVLARCPVHNHVCLSDGSVQQLGKNRSLMMKDGKYYMADPNATNSFYYNRLMMERYGLIPKSTPTQPTNSVTYE